jgi:arylsulfatase A-like enzyme
MSGTAPKTVHIPGSFLGTSFNVVALEITVRMKELVSIQFLTDGKPIIGSRGIALEGAATSQVLLFPVAQSRLHAKPFDTLEVQVKGGGGEIAIHDVALLSRPISSWLPDPDKPADLIALGDDLRRGVGLSSLRALAGDLLAPEPGGFLSFSFGVPAPLRYPLRKAPQPTLFLGLTGSSGKKIERSFPMPRGARWKSVRIPLEGFADERIQLSYRLESDSQFEALCALGDIRVHEPFKGAPSVLLITSDTHRADHLGASGNRVDIQTPHLDAFAKRGLFFENCYTATNVTNPSHIALMTAIHPRDTAILNNYRPLLGAANTLAEKFREAGYATLAATSAKHLGHEISGLGQGFDRMYRPRVPQVNSRLSISALEYYLSDYEGTPVFVWLHVFDAHTPYDPPKPYDQMYIADTATTLTPGALNVPPGDQRGPVTPVNAGLVGSAEDVVFQSAQYRGEITFLDSQLRRVFEIPRFKEGIIAFTADHGENIGHHGIYCDHAGLYPSSIHVPLIIAYPNSPKDFRISAPVEQIHVGRTLLELAGIDADGFPGENLIKHTMSPAPEAKAPRFAVSAHGQCASLNYRQWHLILHLCKHKSGGVAEVIFEQGETELYNLASDPQCASNILEENFDLARALRARLVAWLGNADSSGLGGQLTNDEEMISQLAALGYTMAGDPGMIEPLWDPDCDTEWCRRFE